MESNTIAELKVVGLYGQDIREGEQSQPELFQRCIVTELVTVQSLFQD